MASELEIYHIDVVSSGDATLIIVKQAASLVGAAPGGRSALIGGGRQAYAPAVNCAAKALGARQNLNVVVSPHYDVDHLGGLFLSSHSRAVSMRKSHRN